jgi:hypothetical protein
VDAFFAFPGLGVNAECLTDRQVLPLGTGGYAQVQGLANGALEYRRNPHLAGGSSAHGALVGHDAVGLQALTLDQHKRAGENTVRYGTRFNFSRYVALLKEIRALPLRPDRPAIRHHHRHHPAPRR